MRQLFPVQRKAADMGSYPVDAQVPAPMARRLIADILPIGEQDREVRKFIERDLGGQDMHRSVLVIATSNKPVLIRKGS